MIGCLASAFGGILAYGLMQMNGLAGKAGWRWIFIIEGIVSFLGRNPCWPQAIELLIHADFFEDYMCSRLLRLLLACRLP